MIGPLSGMGWNSAAEVVGRAAQARPRRDDVLNAVTPRLVRDLRHAADRGPRLRGPRRRRRAPVAIVNEAFARHFFGGAAAGRAAVRYETGPGEMTEVEIVGVVEDAAYRGLRDAFPPTMYRPAAQVSRSAAVPEPDGADGAGGAPGLQPALTRAIRGVDPALDRDLPGAGRSHPRSAHRGPHDRDAVGVLRRAGADPGGDRALRRDVLRRQRARREIGIRLTLGAGRAAAERFVLRARGAAGGDRRRARPRRQRRAVAGRAHAALRARAARSGDDRRSPPSS